MQDTVLFDDIGSDRSSSCEVSDEMNVKVLQLLFYGLGLLPSRRQLHTIPRLSLTLAAVFCIGFIVYLCTTIEWTDGARHGVNRHLLYFAIGCDAAFCALIYFCGLRWTAALNRNQKASRPFRRTVESFLGLGSPATKDPWLLVNLGISLGSVLLVAIETAYLIEYQQVHRTIIQPLATFTCIFLYGVVLKIHCFTVYFAVASRLTEISREIANLAESLTEVNVHARCRHATETHLRLNNELGSILKLIYVLYFAKLMIDAPAQSPLAQCNRYIFIFLSYISNLHVFLVIASRADHLFKSYDALRAKVRYQIVTQRSDELEIFYRSEFGVLIGVGSGGPICWKSCYAFIGFVWSFTFIIIQLVMTILPAECG